MQCWKRKNSFIHLWKESDTLDFAYIIKQLYRLPEAMMGFKDLRFIFFKIRPERFCGLFHPVALEPTHRIAQTYFCCNLTKRRNKCGKKFWEKEQLHFELCNFFFKKEFFLIYNIRTKAAKIQITKIILSLYFIFLSRWTIRALQFSSTPYFSHRKCYISIVTR